MGTDGNNNPCRVGTLSLWDLYSSYTGFKNWKLTLGVQNLFDKDPAVVAASTLSGLQANPTLYDVIGRTYRVGLRFQY